MTLYEFERFTLDAERRLLTDQRGTVVDVTPKALEILCLLVENAGSLVTKEEIFKRVWPDSFVEEANLSHHIFKLRKALETDGEPKLIETIPKRGYRFVGELKNSPVGEGLETNITHGRSWAPVAIGLAAIVLTAAAGWFVYSRATSVPSDTSTLSGPRSIAVMPFVNESGGEEIEYLSNGMTETLINSLSTVPSLSVKSRAAVFRYKGRDVSYATIATELDVQAMLLGRLTVRGGDLNLFLSLIDPQTENQIWGKQYARKLSDLVGLQEEIGRDVAQSLQARLNSATEADLSKNYSKKGEAYRLYLLGDYHWAKFTKDGFLKAKKYYEDSIAIDPEYALAYTGIANTYAVLAVNGHMSPAEARPKVRSAAERARELAPDLAEVHVAFGAYKMFFEWDLEGADREFKRAMELEADWAVPHELYAYSIRARGRHEEAIAETKQANEIDPLYIMSLGDIAVCYRFAGQPERALEYNARLLEMDPNFGDARFENALVLADLGRYDEAMQEVTKALALTGNSTKVKSGVGIIYGRMGNKVAAQKVIDELLAESKEKYVSPLDIALVYSTMNEKDKAFEWLENAFQERAPWLMELNVNPELATLRQDPRFKSLSDRIGLTRWVRNPARPARK